MLKNDEYPGPLLEAGMLETPSQTIEIDLVMVKPPVTTVSAQLMTPPGPVLV
jgi:hypothetical protein